MSLSVFEAIREQVELVELARHYTELKRAGKLMCGRCPIHKESTPSFFVYPDAFHCFGCSFHGDAVDLWSAVKGLNPGIESALDLGREYNLKLPERDPEAEQKAVERRGKEAQYEKQARACYQALTDHPNVREWWQKRGFNKELQKQFLLGANRDGTAGVIPYWYRGRIQGLIRRQLVSEPKYLLPRAEEFPEGHKPLFIPSGITGDIHLVEGFIDALALAALGFNSIAIGGTGINERQKAELQKLKGDIFILPDADDEGRKAGRNWLNELYPQARLCPSEYGGQIDA